MQKAKKNEPQNCARKVTKKVTTSKMSKNPKPAAASSSSSPPDNYKESPQNARLDTSESDEESVSEVNARLKNCSSSLSRAAPPKVTPEKCEKKICELKNVISERGKKL